MCDLFGMSCAKPDRATRSLPRFAERYSALNPDGWGIAYYEGGKARVIRRPRMARGDPQFERTVEKARSEILVAHLRLGNVGGVCEQNCHPFCIHSMDTDFVFAHNGTVRGIPHPRDGTDSEAVFRELLREIETYTSLDQFRGIYPAILHGIKTVLKNYGSSVTLNFLLSDGSLLYAFNHYPDKPIFLLRREKDQGGAILISTQKLTYEKWVEIRPDSLLVLSKGRVLVLSDQLEESSG